MSLLVRYYALGALSMSDSLSTSAGTHCESFVAGGAFDRSGMIAKSEIFAKAPIGSASEVCTAWQGRPDHLRQHHAHRHFQHGRCLLVLLGGRQQLYLLGHDL